MSHSAVKPLALTGLSTTGLCAAGLEVAPQNAALRDSLVPAEASLSWHIERAIRDYLEALQGDDPNDLYEVMLTQLEKPLLTVVLEHTRGNQSRSADILGLNRGTLRKKMKIHHLM